MAKVSPTQAMINRSLLVVGTSVLSLFARGPFMIGPSLILAAIGFQEVVESLQDPGQTGKPEEP